MDHIHTLVRVPLTTRVECEGCDIKLRLATYDEAVYVDLTDMFLPDGPMEFTMGRIVVPQDFSLFQVMSDADSA